MRYLAFSCAIRYIIRMEQKIPTDYALCQNDACPHTADCLRYICFKEQTSDNISIRVLNPKFYPADGAECKYFSSTEKVRVAWGVKGIFDSIPYNEAKAIKKELISHFGRTKFYQFFREERAIMPKDQAEIKGIFAKNGIQSEIACTRFTEEYDW